MPAPAEKRARGGRTRMNKKMAALSQARNNHHKRRETRPTGESSSADASSVFDGANDSNQNGTHASSVAISRDEQSFDLGPNVSETLCDVAVEPIPGSFEISAISSTSILETTNLTQNLSSDHNYNQLHSTPLKNFAPNTTVLSENDKEQYLAIYKRIQNELHERIRVLEADAFPTGFQVVKMDSTESVAHIRHTSASRCQIYARSIETTVRFSDLNQPAKSRRLELLRNYLETLVGCSDEKEMAACLDSFLNNNQTILKHMDTPKLVKGCFSLSASDTLDFKEHIGLSWEQLRNAKRFLFNRSVDTLASGRQLWAETESRKIRSSFDFSYANIVEAKQIVQKPCIVIADLNAYLKECWNASLQSGQLNHDTKFNNKIWLGIAGDKGGGSTKLIASFLNFSKPQSVHNVHILGYYDGDDKRVNLRSAFGCLEEQFAALHNFTLPYPTPDGSIEERHVEIFLIGDTMFLSAFCGHKGPSAKHPCVFCTVVNDDLRTTGEQKDQIMRRTYKPRNLNSITLSMEQPTLFAVSLENIVPPVMHIPLGIFSDVFKAIHDQAKQIDLLDHFNFIDREDASSSKKLLDETFETIDQLEKQDALIMDDVKLYASIVNYLNKLINSGCQPPTKRCCTSPVCMDEFPKLKPMAGQMVFCKECSRGGHMVCALVLSANQAKSFDTESWLCTWCTGIETPEALRSACDEALKSIREEADQVRRQRDTARLQADQYHRRMKNFRGEAAEQLFEALDKLGVDLQAYHSGTFVGNHMHKLLTINDKIDGPRLLTEALSKRPETRTKFYNFLVLFGDVFRLTSSTKFFTDCDIRTLESKLAELTLTVSKSFQDTTTTPKMHMLLHHVLPFVRRHRTIGLLTEQSIESLHAEMNGIMRKFTMRDPRRRLPLAVQKHHLKASVRTKADFAPKSRRSNDSSL